ncbi:hypothetical protein CROQUDRAFT_653229 [Cronartium quercuum f. sp. fusiforme G11]|uniref:Choline transporter-like protein n=1 Tax=Cronartium quercuum f. sp. fusiforme G11 TaxID=708437 RepID=A0A9P6NSZ1_9BASI|nr:hypothetical protein CROQUDRAFT_653229 [Cronartium quercuum f. sp. fusiforme G11]
MPALDDQGGRRFDPSTASQAVDQRSFQHISQSSYLPHHHGTSQSFTTPAEGPSFSRFLSQSIAPLYKSRYFPSNNSEVPLFFSTREGYETGLTDGEEIIPNENDHRLQNEVVNGKGRGIDEEPDESDSSRLLSSEQGTIIEGKPKKESHVFNPIAQSDPQASSSAVHTGEEYADAGDDDDSPFYVEDEISGQIMHQSVNPPVMQLPRHLMASHALSHLMASEIAYGNRQYQASSVIYQPTISHSSARQNSHGYQTTNSSHQHSQFINPSAPPGWKMYEAIDSNAYRDDPHQGPSHLDQQALGEPDHQISPPNYSSDNRTRHDSIRLTPPSNIERHVSQSSDLTQTTLDIPKHPLIRPRPPEIFAPNQPNPHHKQASAQEAYPVSSNAFLEDPLATTPYIYPSEARDIGADVLGHSALGPQNYRDSFWMALWLGSLLYAFVQSIWVLLISKTEVPEAGQATPSSKSNLLKSLPVLALLITLSFGFCIMSLSLLVMVKKSIKLLVYGSLIGVPSVLSMIGLWTWSESLSDASFIGMGWISFSTFLASSILVKLIWNERKRIDRTIKVLELSTGVIIEHPSLVLVCLATTIMCIMMSLPFVTLVYKLVLLGSYDHNRWVIDSGSVIQAIVTAFIWSWTLNVIRNLQRIVISGVVSHWYFNRHSPPSQTHKGYSTIESTYSSISRAVGPSLGTVCLASFLLTCFDTTRQMLKWSNKLTSSKSSISNAQNGGHGLMNFLFCSNPIARLISDNVLWVIGPVVAFGCKMFEFLTNYTMIYSGITGFSYWESSKRVTSLLNRNGQIGLAHNLLVKLILNLVSLTISLTLGLIGYTIVNGRQQTNQSENENVFEPLIFILCGVMPFWILRFVTDLIANSVDTLFCCWNIDLDIGTNHSNKTEEAFTGRNVARQARE